MWLKMNKNARINIKIIIIIFMVLLVTFLSTIKVKAPDVIPPLIDDDLQVSGYKIEGYKVNNIFIDKDLINKLREQEYDFKNVFFNFSLKFQENSFRNYNIKDVKQEIKLRSNLALQLDFNFSIIINISYPTLLWNGTTYTLNETVQELRPYLLDNELVTPKIFLGDDYKKIDFSDIAFIGGYARIYNTTIELRIDKLNLTSGVELLLDPKYNNKTDGFSTASIGSASPFGLAINKSFLTSPITDFWITDTIDDFVYHTTYNGTNLSDGFKVPSGISAVNGIGANLTNLILIDSNSYSFLNLLGVEISSAGVSLQSPTDISLNNSNFFLLESTPNNLTKMSFPQIRGYSINISNCCGSQDPTGLDMNITDFWITDSLDDFVYHTTYNGTNLSNGFSTLPFGIGQAEDIAVDNAGSNFWIVDSTDDFVYHINFTEHSPAYVTNYTNRRRITIENINDTNSLFAGIPINLNFNHTDLVFNSKSYASGIDVKIYYYNGSEQIELDRFADMYFNATDAYTGKSQGYFNTSIWFKLNKSIPPFSIDNDYWLYYNNASGSVSIPKDNGSLVFPFFDDFVGTAFRANIWNSGTNTIGGGFANVTDGAGSDTLVTDNEGFVRPGILGMGIAFNDGTDAGTDFFFGWQCAANTPCTTAPWFMFIKRDTAKTVEFEYDTDVGFDEYVPAIEYKWDLNVIQRYQIKWQPTGPQRRTEWWQNNTMLGNFSNSNQQDISRAITLRDFGYAGTMIIDYVYFANMSLPFGPNLTNPRVSLGGEESGADTTKPYFTSIIKNDSSVQQNDNINFSTIANDETALQYYWFETNSSGTWRNSTLISISGTANQTWNITKVNASVGDVVGWRFWANDTSNNVNQTGLQEFTVVSADTCTLTAGSNNAVNCYDNCTQSSNINMNKGNITISGGRGIFNVFGNITNYVSFTVISPSAGTCEVKIAPGGSI